MPNSITSVRMDIASDVEVGKGKSYIFLLSRGNFLPCGGEKKRQNQNKTIPGVVLVLSNFCWNAVKLESFS